MTEQQYRVILQEDAEKQFRKLDKAVQRRINVALVNLEADPRPSGVKKLKGRENDWRIRVGDWRIIYEIHDGELHVLVIEIGHRSKVYRDILGSPNDAHRSC